MRRFLIAVPLIVALAACDEAPSGGGGGTTRGGGGERGGAAKTGGGGGEAKPAAVKKAPPDAWETWNACKEGTKIEFEMEASGMKMRIVKTLDKKGEPHTLKIDTLMKVGDNDMSTPGEEKVEKTKPAGDGNCPMCNKALKDHKDEGKWSDETVKVGDQDVKCMKYETPAKSCKGDDQPKSTMWYSTDVPGGLVKMETAQVKMTLVKTEKK